MLCLLEYSNEGCQATYYASLNYPHISFEQTINRGTIQSGYSPSLHNSKWNHVAREDNCSLESRPRYIGQQQAAAPNAIPMNSLLSRRSSFAEGENGDDHTGASILADNWNGGSNGANGRKVVFDLISASAKFSLFRHLLTCKMPIIYFVSPRGNMAR